MKAAGFAHDAASRIDMRGQRSHDSVAVQPIATKAYCKPKALFESLS